MGRDHVVAGLPAAAICPSADAARADRSGVVAVTGQAAEIAATGLAQALAAVAVAAFAGPPWNEPPGQARAMADQLLGDTSRSGFVLALAVTAGGADLAGFAYGLPRWQLAALAGQRPEPARQPPFEFCEIAVLPAARGRGTGAALHDAIVAVSGPQRRWLATHTAAAPALSLYRSRGWQATRLVPGPGDGTPRVLMTRPR